MRLLPVCLGAALLLGVAQLQPVAAAIPAADAFTSAQAARQADMAGIGTDPRALLDAADNAFLTGDWNLGTEFIERAETALMNTHGILGVEALEEEKRGPTLQALQRAREAVAMDDGIGAREAISAARTEMETAPAEPATGA